MKNHSKEPGGRGYQFTILFFVASCAYITIKHLFYTGQTALALLGPVALLFLLVRPIAEKLLKMKLGKPMECVILWYAFVGFSMGTALRWYDWFPHFDKLMHLFSGLFFFVAGMCLLGILQQEYMQNRRKNPILQLSYGFFFSMFIAVMWEVFEFTGFLLTGHDAQHTLTTGVFDTMQDLISCIVGSIVAAASYLLYVKKEVKSPSVRALLGFDRINYRGVE